MVKIVASVSVSTFEFFNFYPTFLFGGQYPKDTMQTRSTDLRKKETPQADLHYERKSTS